jgi:uncharacterized protein (UPF0335 family)
MTPKQKVLSIELQILFERLDKLEKEKAEIWNLIFDLRDRFKELYVENPNQSKIVFD